MGAKRCPHCGDTHFMSKVTYAANVQSMEDGTFKILQQTNNYEVLPVKCASCKKIFLDGLNDLVDWTCKKCGKPSQNLDEDGVCDICKAMETRPDLAKATQEDLIRMILKLESSKDVATEAPETVTEEVSEPTSTIAQSKVEAAKEAIANAQPEEEPTEDKPKRKRRVAKSKTPDEPLNDTLDGTLETTEESKSSIGMNPPVEESIPEPINTEDPFSANTIPFVEKEEIDSMKDVEDAIFPIFEEEQAF